MKSYARTIPPVGYPHRLKSHCLYCGVPGHYWTKQDTRERKNVIWDYEMPPSLP
jgi:uncharacterized protein (DUF427 family)